MHGRFRVCAGQRHFHEHQKTTFIVDLTERVCPGGSCRTVLDGRVVTFDSHHFTTEFAVGLTDAFKRILSE